LAGPIGPPTHGPGPRIRAESRRLRYRCLQHPDRLPDRLAQPLGLSRTLILEQVWGQHHDTLTNVVDVYIRYLRNKVDKGFSHKLIHTVRDIGYKISE